MRSIAATGLMLAALLAGRAAAAETEPAAKDHALFLGCSAWTEAKGASREIIGATGENLVLEAAGKKETLPLAKLSALRLERALRLSNVVAQVDDWKSEPVRNSNAELDSLRQVALMTDLAQAARGAADHSVRGYQDQQTIGALATEAAGVAAAQANMAAAAGSFSNAVPAADAASRFVNGAGPGDGPNALTFSCSLSAPVEVRDAYLMVVTAYRPKGDEALQHQAHFESLARLGTKAQKLSFTQTGLPAGFRLEGTTVHVFSDGKEIATNLSERRIDLTADEALRYLVLCYVATHPKEDLAAAPMQVALPADFRNRVAADQLERPYYLKVGTDGVVQSISASPSSAVAVDGYVESTVRKFRFNPALKQGKPIESVVELKLRDYIN